MQICSRRYLEKGDSGCWAKIVGEGVWVQHKREALSRSPSTEASRNHHQKLSTSDTVAPLPSSSCSALLPHPYTSAPNTDTINKTYLNQK